MVKKKVKNVKKVKEELELNVPVDFVGEVVGTVSKGSDESGVAPITRDFHNEELHVLRDKINELIAKG